MTVPPADEAEEGQTASSQAVPMDAVGLRGLFRIRNARVYFAGITLSLIGDNILSLAAGVWIKTLTGNNGAAGLVMFFVLLPSMFSPVFGMLADRVRKRSLMITVNAVMILVPLLLLFVHDRRQVVLIYVVMLAYGVATITLASASSGLFVAMFPERLLSAANGFTTSLQEGMKVIAPALGAALFVWVGGGWIGVIDSVTFMAACGALLLLKVREPDPVIHERRLVSEMSAGLRHITAVPDLRRLVFSAGLVMLAIGLLSPALYAVVDTDLHRPPAFLGVVVAAQGIGSVLGGLLATRFTTVLGEMRLVTIGAGLVAAGTVTLLIPNVAVVLGGSAARGAGLAWVIIGAINLLQRRTPTTLIGRAAAALYMLVFAPSAVSILTSSGLSQWLSHRVLILATVLATASVCAYLLFHRSQRAEPGTPLPAAGGER